ncbi:hypothetical protein Taro_048304 [Colocasia esculenta]|uniref:Uncharacterized protein n=1 Tax=Colocasia esculenta TaxID=4460 RepID=A0A843WY15_COLES|nr:hypothetical protein [Colocasia esculenta]
MQSSKVENTYCQELQSSGTEKCHDPQPESGPTRLPQNQRIQHNAEATSRHAPAETEKLTEDRSNHSSRNSNKAEATSRHAPSKTEKLTENRSNHVRPESHDTSTQHPRPPRGREGIAKCHYERHRTTT